jgi:hypothetical protein
VTARAKIKVSWTSSKKEGWRLWQEGPLANCNCRHSSKQVISLSADRLVIWSWDSSIELGKFKDETNCSRFYEVLDIDIRKPKLLWRKAFKLSTYKTPMHENQVNLSFVSKIIKLCSVNINQVSIHEEWKLKATDLISLEHQLSRLSGL